MHKIALALGAFVLGAYSSNGAGPGQTYEHPETRELVALVNDAASLIERSGKAAFDELRVPGGRFRNEENYIFVLDPQGDMLVHIDPQMEGKNQLELEDINGKPIIRGLIDAATSLANKPQGWFHYQWPAPSELLPRWKSSYVKLVEAPDGKRFIVGSGMYNDRMEKSFVVDLVQDAVGEIERNGAGAFPTFHDPEGRFIAKDAYVFVIDPEGKELVNPAFPNLEGRNLMDLKDSNGKALIREMVDVVETGGAGWVEYMWPKPGESVPAEKSAYVSKATLGDSWVLVGAGVYLADAKRAATPADEIGAADLMTLVRDAAALLEQSGEAMYPELRRKGSKWRHDDVYFFVWSVDGVRRFHAADPSLEGKNGSDVQDVNGRRYGRMFLEAAESPSGEGWAHYMYPEPGDIFPAWKSVFLKKVRFPSGQERVVGCGIYNLKMDKPLIEDVVHRASQLVQSRGKAAFPLLRDKTGPFMFMDTYVFVDTPAGVEMVNGAQPSLEGRNVADLRDVNGKAAVRDYIDAALKSGSAWVEYAWYRPGDNTPTKKQAYVLKVESPDGVFIIGSGFYPDTGR